MKNNKHSLLKVLFAESAKLGIDQETLREDIAPAIIRKRLSAAKSWEVARVLDHIKNPLIEGRSKGGMDKFKYESSKQGLIEEIRDIARARFGEDYAAQLNAFCARFGETDGFRKMRVNQMKVVKQRLLELQKMDPRESGQYE